MRRVLVELLVIAAILGGGFLAGVLVERHRARPPLDAEQSAVAEQIRAHPFFQTPPTPESIRQLADRMVAPGVRGSAYVNAGGAIWWEVPPNQQNRSVTWVSVFHEAHQPTTLAEALRFIKDSLDLYVAFEGVEGNERK
jgi:hypothetical protein